MMRRREFNLALASLAFAPSALAAPPRGPLFWLATRGKARVFLMSFAEAKPGDDSSFFTPALRKAFQDSSELWIEVAPSEALADRTPEEKAKGDAEYQELSHEPPGRTFFDELTSPARTHVQAYMTELGIKKDELAPLRPWAAYYKINAAYWSRTKFPFEIVNFDHALWKMAKDQGKFIGYEMPTGVAFAQFMAAMPRRAQSQYIEFLLNYFDDNKKGLDSTMFDWQTGTPNTSMRNLTRMRTQLPDLYRSIQVQRNTWWAHKIDDLLSSDKTCFIGMGHMHTIGPDGIPSQLQRLKIVDSSNLRENPPYAG